jgi:hypothetical protein
MKNHILTTALLFATIIATAQTEEQAEAALAPRNNHKTAAEVQMRFGLNNGQTVVSPYLKFRFFAKPNLAIRTGLGLMYLDSTINFRENADGTGSLGTYKSSNFTLLFPIGMEFHFKQSEKLSPYAGFDLIFGYGQTKGTGTRADDSSFIGIGYQEQSTASSITYGINAILGVDWYFIPRLYAGAEVGFGLSGTSQMRGTTEITVPDFFGTVTTTSTTEPSSTVAFGNNFQAGIRLGWRF